MEEIVIGSRVKYISGNFGDEPHNPLWQGSEGMVGGDCN